MVFVLLYVTGSRKRGHFAQSLKRRFGRFKSRVKKKFFWSIFFIPVYEYTLLCLTSDKIYTKINTSKAPSALCKDRHLKSNFFRNA